MGTSRTRFWLGSKGRSWLCFWRHARFRPLQRIQHVYSPTWGPDKAHGNGDNNATVATACLEW